MNPMETNTSTIKVVGIAVGITLFLTVLVLVHYQRISKRPGSLVIPAGNTYLGPNAPKQNAEPVNNNTWREVKGLIFPYTMSVPADLKLITFDNDPYDIYAIDCCNVPPDSNVLIGVDTVKTNITQSKMDYVRNWWHQFSGLKSVASIEEFTNSKGLKGYKAKFVNSAGETPNLDVFFEVPDHPENIIHLTSGTLDADTFAKIIDSIGWKP